MKVNIERKEEETKVNKGDVLVFALGVHRKHYMVVENKLQGHFTLLNLGNINLISSIKVGQANEILPIAKRVFPRLDFVEVIPADSLEVRTV